MIKETGNVINKIDHVLWVETTITSSCNACAAKSNCGSSVIAKAFSDKSVVNEVENTLDANIGDVVEIGIPEESILVGSFYLYMLPLLIAILFAVVTQFTLSNIIEIKEIHVILSTFLGGGFGFFFAKKLIENSDNTKYKIQLIKVLPEVITIKELKS